MVPILTNKGVFEPSYNDLKFRVWNCNNFYTNLIELDMEQWTGSKLGKKYVRAVYGHSVYLTSLQSTSCEILC